MKQLLGRQLGKYRIEEEIGRGGMSVVYKGHDSALDRYIAVKVLAPHLTGEPEFVQRFLREARAAARLKHPHIVTIHDVGQQGNWYFFVMEYLEGLSLEALILQHGIMPLDQILPILQQMADALDYAHQQGIIHRDVKPGNVIVSPQGLAILTDFGIAKAVHECRITAAGTTLGTPVYMAPEQILAEEIGPEADLYALGIVAYEMLAGRPPFEAAAPVKLLYQALHQPPPPIRNFRPDLPSSAEEVLARVLSKLPRSRYLSGAAFVDALDRALTSKLLERGIDVGLTLGASKKTIDEEIAQHVFKGQPAHLFICYKRGAEPDQTLALYLHEFFTARGHDVFIDQTIRTGVAWIEEIDQQIKSSDFLIGLLSKASADSEMVQSEVRRAYEYRKLQGHPHTLPVRIAYEGLLPYSIDAFINPLQYVVWRKDTDNERVAQDILAALEGRLPEQTLVQVKRFEEQDVISEDGRIVADDDTLYPPLPEFDPRFMEELATPGGAVRLRDKLYIERDADVRLRREIVRRGTTTTIRAPRQTGKSSLLVRGVHHARKSGAQVVQLDMQRVDKDYLETADIFLRYLAEFVVHKLGLDAAKVGKVWRGSLGSQDKLTALMEEYVLSESTVPIVLAMDEVDRLLLTDFHTGFFALLRSWYNSAAYDERWEMLNIVMVISTEPYLLIADVNQSPFNVGLKLYLEDLNEAQVRELGRRHGSPVKEKAFPRLMKLLNGHPYLTRKALYTLVVDKLTWADLARVAASDQGPFSDHLRRYHWLLYDKPALKKAFSQIIRRDRCTDETAFLRLLRAGLVKGSGDVCSCRCDLYRRYFKDRL